MPTECSLSELFVSLALEIILIKTEFEVKYSSAELPFKIARLELKKISAA